MCTHIGDTCIQKYHLGRYVVGYTIGNLVKLKIRQYTSPKRHRSSNEIDVIHGVKLYVIYYLKFLKLFNHGVMKASALESGALIIKK